MGDRETADSDGSKTIGFHPSYLPDSAPPYQPNFLSFDNNVPPPDDPDTSSYNTRSPLVPKSSANEIGINFPSTKEFHLANPSAPSIDEIDFRIGLTEAERQAILNALSKMRANVLWLSEEEKTDFSLAEDEVIELLHDVESKLTNSEKEEFLIELRKINHIRNEEELKGHGFLEIATKWCRQSLTVGLKILELVMSIVIFVNLTEPKRSLDRRITFIFFEFVGILSACFLISYCCNAKRARNVRLFVRNCSISIFRYTQFARNTKEDTIFCSASTIGCGLAGCFASDHNIGVYAFLAMTTYGVDTLWKFCQKSICGD